MGVAGQKSQHEFEGQFLQHQNAMIKVQSNVLGVKVMEAVDNLNMECLTYGTAETQCLVSIELHEEILNGMAELPPLIGTNLLPQWYRTVSESGDGTSNAQCREANASHKRMAELPLFIGTNSLPQCSFKAVGSGEDGVQNSVEVNAVLLEIGVNSSAEWPRHCTRHAQCDSGDEQKLQAKSKVKHDSFNDDDGEWIERYDPKTKCWVKELWSEDDSDDHMPEVFKWAEGTFDGSESDGEDEDYLRTMLFLDLLKQRQMEEEFMKEKTERKSR